MRSFRLMVQRCAWSFVAFFLVASAVGSGGCVPFIISAHQPPRAHPEAGEIRFDGIRTLADGGDLNIIFIHGIGNYAPGDPERFIKSFQDALGLTREDPCKPEAVPVLYGDGKQVGKITTWEFTHIVEEKPRRVRMQKVEWKDAVDKAKCEALRNESERRHRLSRQHVLKAEEINPRVADAAMYLSDMYGDKIRHVLRTAIRDIDGREVDAGQKERSGARFSTTVVISHSLGSRVLFDVLTEDVTGDASAVLDQSTRDSYADSVVRVFMLANQLSMLGLATEDHPLSKLNSSKSEKAVSEESPFRFVAIADSNDVLNFRLEFENLVKNDPERRVNRYAEVEVSLGRIGWFLLIPGLWGGVTWPADAHSNFSKSNEVLDLIIEGYGN